ncbi:cyanobacterial phytochrome B [Geobacter sp. OR-1]|uniref:sensor histidine kinase n=1 Tax=Geobacter sp. OR-1 TaxID=1266765 RepID=UPI0005424BF4|nr:ATP-binding protein [Geobacter sp. OR-1]GAM10692.1 cyanobacterial phytochrome B [Geobacter sp. OR-1]
MKQTILLIMSLSILFQFMAAYLAVRLILVSGAIAAWIFLASGFVLQGVRRAIALQHLLSGNQQGDMTVEVLGMVISLLMLCGIWKFGPLFADIKRTHQDLLDRQSELAALNRSLEEEVVERQQLEESLRNTNTILEKTFASLDESIFIVETGTGRILDANVTVERMFGYSRDELLGANTTCLHLTTEMADRFRREMLQAYADKGVFETRYRMRRKDGTDFDSEHLASPILYEQGDVKNHVSVVRDITERKRFEDELRSLNEELDQRVAQRTMDLQRLNRELETFCYSISHELRAPLARLQGFSGALAESPEARHSGALTYLSERIGVASLRLRSVIDSLLLMNRLARTEVLKEPVNLSVLSGQTARELLAETPERSVRLEIAPDLLVQADRSMLTICMRNLIGNALKYSAKVPEAEIEIGRTEVAAEPVYFVRDNGAGFNMSFADKLFEPFCRLHSEVEFEGSGMGLPIVQRIIERHGGRIWADAAEGKGATFYFTLGERVKGEG